MDTYIKKPVVIQAQRLTKRNLNELRVLTNSSIVIDGRKKVGLLIKTLEGNMRADIGDWIIRGIKGEYYPCKPDIFEQTYQSI